MQALRQFLAEVADTDLRFSCRVAALEALHNLEGPGLLKLMSSMRGGPQVPRYVELLMGAYNAIRD